MASVETDIGDGVRVIVAAGEFDRTTAALLADALDAAIRMEHGDVVLDLSDVAFFDLEALRTTLQSNDVLKQEQRRLAVVATPNSLVQRVLDVASASESISVYTDRRTALAALRRPGDDRPS